MRCDGEQLAAPGNGFLEQVAHGNTPPTGGDVIVVDGGNTAMDCARTSRRRGALGITMISRGFDVEVAPPFDRPLAEAQATTAIRCAEACPAGALALRTQRVCE